MVLSDSRFLYSMCWSLTGAGCLALPPCPSSSSSSSASLFSDRSTSTPASAAASMCSVDARICHDAQMDTSMKNKALLQPWRSGAPLQGLVTVMSPHPGHRTGAVDGDKYDEVGLSADLVDSSDGRQVELVLVVHGTDGVSRQRVRMGGGEHHLIQPKVPGRLLIEVRAVLRRP
jgi:hypothetical protein